MQLVEGRLGLFLCPKDRVGVGGKVAVMRKRKGIVFFRMKTRSMKEARKGGGDK
jgi:hypothetical protein